MESLARAPSEVQSICVSPLPEKTPITVYPIEGHPWGSDKAAEPPTHFQLEYGFADLVDWLETEALSPVSDKHAAQKMICGVSPTGYKSDRDMTCRTLLQVDQDKGDRAAFDRAVSVIAGQGLAHFAQVRVKDDGEFRGRIWIPLIHDTDQPTFHARAKAWLAWLDKEADCVSDTALATWSQSVFVYHPVRGSTGPVETTAKCTDGGAVDLRSSPAVAPAPRAVRLVSDSAHAPANDVPWVTPHVAALRATLVDICDHSDHIDEPMRACLRAIVVGNQAFNVQPEKGSSHPLPRQVEGLPQAGDEYIRDLFFKLASPFPCVHPDAMWELVSKSFELLADQDRVAGWKPYTPEKIIQKWVSAVTHEDNFYHPFPDGMIDSWVARAQAANGPPKPVLMVGGTLPDLIDGARHCLAQFPDTYWRRGSDANEIVQVETEPTIGLRALSDKGVNMLFARNARIIKPVKDDDNETRWVECDPPDKMVPHLVSESNLPVPFIKGITASPILRPDLSVFSERGYDPLTGLFCTGQLAFDETMLPVVSEAKAIIDDLFCDFPFESEYSRAAAIAGLLTVVARPAIDGNTPCFGFDASVPGAGKTLIPDCISIITQGVKCSPQAQVDDTEFEKRIMPLALAGDPIVLIDNINKPLGGGPLEMAITAGIVQGRTLGKSETRTAPARMVWMATGNNLSFTRDMTRRVIPCRLVPDCERPEERTGFRHPELRDYARENRARLLAACIAIVRGVRATVRPLGSFEDWSRVIVAPMVAVGWANPIDGQSAIRAWDNETNTIEELLTAIKTAGPNKTSKELSEISDVVRLCGEIGGKQLFYGQAANEIGKILGKFRDRLVSGMKLTGTPGRGGKIRWTVK